MSTSILLPGITALLGTLLGLGGAIFINYNSNRHATKLEKMRIEEERRKEKSNKEIIAIEQTYQILVRTDDLLEAFAYDVQEKIDRNIDPVKRIKEIRTTADAMKMLIPLYLPSIEQDLDAYSINIGKYWNAIGSLHAGKKEQPINKTELFREFTEAQAVYKGSCDKLSSDLKELIKKVLV